MVKNLSAMQETRIQFPGWEDPLEKGLATHSRVLAWRIPWTEEPWEDCRSTSMGAAIHKHKLNLNKLANEQSRNLKVIVLTWSLNLTSIQREVLSKASMYDSMNILWSRNDGFNIFDLLISLTDYAILIIYTYIYNMY